MLFGMYLRNGKQGKCGRPEEHVSPVGGNEKSMKEYIRNEPREDYLADQKSVKECVDFPIEQSITKNKKLPLLEGQPSK